MKCFKCGYKIKLSDYECINCRQRYFMGAAVVETYKQGFFAKFCLSVFIFIFIGIIGSEFYEFIIDFENMSLIDILFYIIPFFILNIPFILTIKFLIYILKSSDHPESIPYEESKSFKMNNPNVRICGKCGNPLKDNVYECFYCVDKYREEYFINKKIENNNKFKSFCLSFLFSLVMIFSLYKLYINFNNIHVYDSKSSAVFVEFLNCNIDDSKNRYCKAVYSYDVNGIEYKIKNVINNEKFKEIIVVSYDSSNPGDAIVGDVKFEYIWVLILIFGLFRKKIKNIFKNLK